MLYYLQPGVEQWFASHKVHHIACVKIKGTAGSLQQTCLRPTG